MKKQIKSTKKNWIWQCTYANNASNWKDSEECHAMAHQPMTQEKAEKAAQRHEDRTGHQARVHKIDARKWRGKW